MKDKQTKRQTDRKTSKIMTPLGLLSEPKVRTRLKVNVRIGDHDLAATGETTIAEKTIAVANIFNHESYAPTTYNNDITVLELAEEVDINTYTPACLAQTSDTDTFNGKTAQVSIVTNSKITKYIQFSLKCVEY